MIKSCHWTRSSGCLLVLFPLTGLLCGPQPQTAKIKLHIYYNQTYSQLSLGTHELNIDVRPTIVKGRTVCLHPWCTKYRLNKNSAYINKDIILRILHTYFTALICPSTQALFTSKVFQEFHLSLIHLPFVSARNELLNTIIQCSNYFLDHQ